MIHSPQVGLYVSGLWLKDDKKEMKVKLYFREQWKDERLQFTAENKDKVVVPKDLESKVWVPDLYFSNSLSIERFQEPHDHRLMNLRTDGLVWRATVYTAVFPCVMDLCSYPKGRQTCSIDIESFSRTADHTNLTVFQDRPPIAFSEYVEEIDEWTRYLPTIEDCTVNYTSGGYSCVRFRISLGRDIGRFHILMHIPYSLLLIIAYVSYYVSRKNAFLRFGYVFLVGILLIAASLTLNS
jgi:hypothetical protein